MAKKQLPLNPFFLSPEMPDAYFCDREAETDKLVSRLTGGDNVLLMSSRRMGKTGLICHMFNQPEIKGRYHTFFIDIYDTSTLEEFVQKLGREIVGKLSRKGFNPLMTFLRSLSSLRGVFSLDPSSGLPSFSVGIGEISRPEMTLDEIFAYLERADKPCIVAIDEFQKIADYQQKNVEAILRSRIQFLRNCRFVFSGSERSVLSQMFFSASRPFYQSTSVLSLEPLDAQNYIGFSERLFGLYGKRVDPQAVNDLYDLVQGYTAYLQRALNESFSLLPPGAVCDRSFIFDRIDELLTAGTDVYKEQLMSMTPNQRALLEAVAVEGKAMNIMSSEFTEKYGLGTVSSVQSAARSLLKRQFLTRDPEKRYYLDDKFFELWLIRSRGITLEMRLEENRRSPSKRTPSQNVEGDKVSR